MAARYGWGMHDPLMRINGARKCQENGCSIIEPASHTLDIVSHFGQDIVPDHSGFVPVKKSPNSAPVIIGKAAVFARDSTAQVCPAQIKKNRLHSLSHF